MDFSAITSVNSYLKTAKLKTQVKLREESGDMTSHKKSLDEWISSQTHSSADLTATSSSGDSQMQTIQTKLSSGKKLTSEEKAYLKEKDPAAYQKAVASEQEQKRYEQELKQCRTKEDVQRLRLSHLSSSLSQVNSIKNNPHISEEKKLQFISIEQGKLAAMDKLTQKFVKQSQYQNLPTDAERAEAEREQREQQEIAQETPSETTDATESDDAKKPTETPDAEVSAAEPQKPAAESTEPAIKPESEALRKTKRAKAMAAYAQTGSIAVDTLPSMRTGTPSIEIEA